MSLRQHTLTHGAGTPVRLHNGFGGSETPKSVFGPAARRWIRFV